MMMEQTTLTALVVYESYFGNTRTIAHAVAEGLRLEGVAPTVQEVSAAVPTDVTGYHLLVVGGPTHAFGLSRESTRADAERRGAPCTSPASVCASGSAAYPHPPLHWRRPSTRGPRRSGICRCLLRRPLAGC